MSLRPTVSIQVTHNERPTVSIHTHNDTSDSCGENAMQCYSELYVCGVCVCAFDSGHVRGEVTAILSA